MRKFFCMCILLSMLLSCGTVYAKSVKLTTGGGGNFTDEIFCEYVRQNFDLNDDGELSDEEIAAVKFIDVQDMGISSLKGIEYFTFLVSLDCPYNNLTELDVSQNTALTSLQCYENQLKTLDVSKNTALVVLTFESNNITEIDVSKCESLVGLGCSNNDLKELDVSKNTALTVLYCYENQITKLDVSKCEVLNELGCSSNDLKELNVSKNTTLTWLNCGGNKITALDVSKNTVLTDMICNQNNLSFLDLSHNPALTTIDCGINNIKELDLSQNTALVELWCWGDQLSELNLEHNPELTLLQCGNNRIDTLNLSHNPKLTELYCWDNDMSSMNLSNNSKLRLFGGGNNQFSNIDLSACTSLTGLDLSGNYLVKLDLSNNTSLDQLYLNATTLRNVDLSNNTSLEILSVCSSDITTLDLTHNTALQGMNCYGNCFLESLRIISSDNSEFPYHVNLRDYVGNNIDRIESINAYKRDGSEIYTQFRRSDGILLCASSPYKIVYAYQNGYSGTASEYFVPKVMNVTVGVPSRTFTYLPRVEPKIDRLEEMTITETRQEMEMSENGEMEIVTKTITYSVIIGDHTIRRVNYNNDDEPESQDETPHYDSENWSTNLALNAGLVNSICNAFPGTSRSDIHLFNQIVTSEAYTSVNIDSLSLFGENLVFKLPETKANSNGIYVLYCTFSDNMKPGEKISLYDLSGSYITKADAVFLDSNYNVIDYVPDNRHVYIAVRLTAGRLNHQAVTSHRNNSSSEGSDAEVSPFMTDRITSSDNTHEKDMKDYIASDHHEVICSLGTFTANEPGIYTFKVSMSDSLFGRLENMSTSEFMIYAFNVSNDTVIHSGIWDILDMSEEKLQVFDDSEFLISGFMTENEPTSLYLTAKASSGIPVTGGSSGGCDSGFMLAVLVGSSL